MSLFSYPWRQAWRQWFPSSISSRSVSAQQNMTEQMNQLSVLVAVPSQGGHLRNWDGLISSKVGLTGDSRLRQAEGRKAPIIWRQHPSTVHLCVCVCCFWHFDWCWLVSRFCFKVGISIGTCSHTHTHNWVSQINAGRRLDKCAVDGKCILKQRQSLQRVIYPRRWCANKSPPWVTASGEDSKNV